MVPVHGMVTIPQKCLGWSWICDWSQHTKYQTPTLPRSVLNFFGQNTGTKPHVFAVPHHKNTTKRNMSSAICALSMYESLNGCTFGLLVPHPHSLIHVKLCTSRICMKMSSFLYARPCTIPRILYFQRGHLITFLTKCHLWCGCQGEWY